MGMSSCAEWPTEIENIPTAIATTNRLRSAQKTFRTMLQFTAKATANQNGDSSSVPGWLDETSFILDCTVIVG